jgi:hypothetical protein
MNFQLNRTTQMIWARSPAPDFRGTLFLSFSPDPIRKNGGGRLFVMEKKKLSHTQESIISSLGLVTKSGKYRLGIAQTVKALRNRDAIQKAGIDCGAIIAPQCSVTAISLLKGIRSIWA